MPRDGTNNFVRGFGELSRPLYFNVKSLLYLMFKKPLILQRKRRIIGIIIVLITLILLAFSPLALGLAMMNLEEITTGKNVGEHNSVWGVLPWLSIGTMMIFLSLALILLILTLVGILHDAIVLIKRFKADRDKEILG